eukprot:58089-Pelagomonas_calceolata.AAC.1
MHIRKTSVEHTRPKNQLEASKQQHRDLYCHLLRASAQVNLHNILLGVGGDIYTPHTLEPPKELGLDTYNATKLAQKLHAHSVQYAYKLASTRRALEKTFLTLISTIRHGLLLETLLILTDFFLLLLLVKRSHGTSALVFADDLLCPKNLIQDLSHHIQGQKAQFLPSDEPFLYLGVQLTKEFNLKHQIQRMTCNLGPREKLENLNFSQTSPRQAKIWSA